MGILTGKTMGILKEGMPYILFFALCTLVFALLHWKILAALFLILTFLTLNFFRDPERIVPDGENIVVSPADGKIVDISRAKDPLDNSEKTKISIFMNIFNVHVTRAPVSGEIKKIKYIPGKFVNAAFDKASQDNERNIIKIANSNGEFTIVQIAGLIARRIVCWAKESEHVEKGQKIGLIKFGSRVDLYLPSRYEIDISLGQKVYGGITVVAKRQQT